MTTRHKADAPLTRLDYIVGAVTIAAAIAVVVIVIVGVRSL